MLIHYTIDQRKVPNLPMKSSVGYRYWYYTIQYQIPISNRKNYCFEKVKYCFKLLKILNIYEINLIGSWSSQREGSLQFISKISEADESSALFLNGVFVCSSLYISSWVNHANLVAGNYPHSQRRLPLMWCMQCFNPFTLRAAETSLMILEIFFLQKHFLENI